MTGPKPTSIPADLVGAELWTDEYGSVWQGEPGAIGSVVVADIVYQDEQGGDLGIYPIQWLAITARRHVPIPVST